MFKYLFYFVFLVMDLVVMWEFYIKLIGCKEGCLVECWIDFDFFGY